MYRCMPIEYHSLPFARARNVMERVATISVEFLRGHDELVLNYIVERRWWVKLEDPSTGAMIVLTHRWTRSDKFVEWSDFLNDAEAHCATDRYIRLRLADGQIITAAPIDFLDLSYDAFQPKFDLDSLGKEPWDRKTIRTWIIKLDQESDETEASN